MQAIDFPSSCRTAASFCFIGSRNTEGGIYVGSLDGMPLCGFLPMNQTLNTLPTAARRAISFFAGRTHCWLSLLMLRAFVSTGPVVPIAGQVSVAGNIGFGAFSVSPDGTLAYISGAEVAMISLCGWIGRGRILGSLVNRGKSATPALSPNGEMVAFVIGNSNRWFWRHLAPGLEARHSFAIHIWTEGERLSHLVSGWQQHYVYSHAATTQPLIFTGKRRTVPGLPSKSCTDSYSTLSVDDWSRDGPFGAPYQERPDQG